MFPVSAFTKYVLNKVLKPTFAIGRFTIDVRIDSGGLAEANSGQPDVNKKSDVGQRSRGTFHFSDWPFGRLPTIQVAARNLPAIRADISE